MRDRCFGDIGDTWFRKVRDRCFADIGIDGLVIHGRITKVVEVGVVENID